MVFWIITTLADLPVGGVQETPEYNDILAILGSIEPRRHHHHRRRNSITMKFKFKPGLRVMIMYYENTKTINK